MDFKKKKKKNYKNHLVIICLLVLDRRKNQQRSNVKIFFDVFNLFSKEIKTTRINSHKKESCLQNTLYLIQHFDL